MEQTAYRRDIKDNGYKSIFTNSWLVGQSNRSWIKGLGKNPQKSELIHWRQCLLSGPTTNRVPSDSEKHLHIHVILHMSRSRVTCWHGSRQNKIAGLNGIRCELVNKIFISGRPPPYLDPPCIQLTTQGTTIVGLRPVYMGYSYSSLWSFPPSLSQLIFDNHAEHTVKTSSSVLWIEMYFPLSHH